ncbi:MAG: hypothetical protein ABJ242_06450 [Marinomonas sp.]|uniref:hypothetical protein n=1 Tax=Parasphingorhabdus sp. TaxID=2709688 RepID=UPI00327BE027
MAKHNFSHLSIITPIGVSELIDRGLRITDEMFVSALGEIHPALLPEPEMTFLLRQIDPKAERRGRPAKEDPSPTELAADIRSIERTDAPVQFLDALGNRLISGKPFTEMTRGQKAAYHFERIRVGMLAHGIAEEFEELLEPGITQVTHPILGTWLIDDVKASPRRRALQVTNDYMRSKGYIAPITPERLNNIISEYRTGKTHKIS